jgi:hypothetical protein
MTYLRFSRSGVCAHPPTPPCASSLPSLYHLISGGLHTPSEGSLVARLVEPMAARGTPDRPRPAGDARGRERPPRRRAVVPLCRPRTGELPIGYGDAYGRHGGGLVVS